MNPYAEVNRPELAWALKAVLPHACKDKDIPQLCGLRLDLDPDEKMLYCFATDRYTFGCARVEIKAGDHPAAAATLPLPDVKELLRRLAEKGTACLRLASDEVVLDEFHRWRPAAENLTGPDWNRFPNWRKLLAGMLRREPGVPSAEWGVNPAYLARFAPVRRFEVPPPALVPIRDGAVYLLMSKDFTGAVMGARRIDGRYDSSPRDELPSWLSAFPAEEEAAA